MEDIQEMQERIDIQRICHFMMYGVDTNNFTQPIDTEYIQHIRKTVTDMLRNKFSDNKEYEDIMGYIYDYEEALERFSVEAGIKSGFQLALQLIGDKKSHSSTKDSIEEINT